MPVLHSWRQVDNALPFRSYNWSPSGSQRHTCPVSDSGKLNSAASIINCSFAPYKVTATLLKQASASQKPHPLITRISECTAYAGAVYRADKRMRNVPQDYVLAAAFTSFTGNSLHPLSYLKNLGEKKKVIGICLIFNCTVVLLGFFLHYHRHLEQPFSQEDLVIFICKGRVATF